MTKQNELPHRSPRASSLCWPGTGEAEKGCSKPLWIHHSETSEQLSGPFALPPPTYQSDTGLTEERGANVEKKKDAERARRLGDKSLLYFFTGSDHEAKGNIRRTGSWVTFLSFQGLWWTSGRLTRSGNVVTANTLSQLITQHLLNVINSPA